MKVLKKLLIYVLVGAILTSGTAVSSFAYEDITTAEAGMGTSRYDLSLVHTYVENLKTDSRVEPVGLDSEIPEFSWKVNSNMIGMQQAAYQIVVATDEDLSKIVWDSGTVTSDLSINIPYGSTGSADTLTPKTQYYWQVTVTDILQMQHTSNVASFTTGLMSDSIDAWQGAKWMGSEEVAVDANSMPIYHIDWTVELQEGTRSGFVFGANDPRLNDSLRNTYGIAGENYIAYVLDISAIPATVEIYRVGYHGSDSADTPLGTFTVPETIINNSNKNLPHTFRLSNPGYVGTLTIDGQVVDSRRTLSPVGTSDSSIVFPRLNDIGFTAGADSKAVFTDVQVSHYQYPYAEVFGENIGATYEIFDGLDGVAVNGSSITVTGNKDGVLAYADPSWGSTTTMRRSFSLDKNVEKAQLYVTARGAYEYYINGAEVAPDEYLNPGFTQFDYTIMYNAYDVTELLQESGENVMGVTMSQGWFGDQQTYEIKYYNYWGYKPSLLAMLEITYADGTSECIVTDESWQYSLDGPIVYSGIFNGETYDARKEAAMEGWSTASYDAADWGSAVEVIAWNAYLAEEDSDFVEATPRIIARVDEPVRVVELLPALDVSEPYPGVYVYDMGTNMVGIPEIVLPGGVAGQEIILRGGEELEDDRTIMFANLRGAMCTDRYIMNGSEAGTTYQPTFTFHGYRYLQITGIDKALPLQDVRGIVLSSVTEQTATYETSNPLVNQLYENTLRSLWGNHLSIPTDCNQRDERMGWTGDAQVFSKAATYMADMNKFYQNWEISMRDAQQLETTVAPQGFYPNTVPTQYPSYRGQPGVVWPAAGIVPVWESYTQYGNLTFIAEHLDSMITQLEAWHGDRYTRVAGCEYLTDGSGLGEHLSIVSTDASLVNNAVYVYCLDLVSKMAAAVGEDATAAKYAERRDHVKAEWQQVFIDPDTGKARSYAANGNVSIQDTQGAYATALFCGAIAPGDQYYDLAVEHYLAAVENGHQSISYALTTGFAATPYLLPVLSDTGNADAAYKMLEQEAYPSWLYPVTQGATSIWENWAGNRMSYNHYAYGAVCSWMINYSAGIVSDENNPGFKHFVLQPSPGGTFTYVDSSYQSYYGMIESAWTYDGNRLQTYSAVVPANTTATLYLPVDALMMDSFVDIAGVTYLGMEEHNGINTAKFSLVAGGYDFVITDGVLTASLQEGYVDTGIDFNLVLSTDAYHVEAGDYANITTEFAKAINSNTAILKYYYDTDLFQFGDFHLANGVQEISREVTDYGAKIVVMIPNYNTQTYGRLAIQAKPDAVLSTGWTPVRAEAEYVLKDDTGDKIIRVSMGSVSFTTFGEGEPQPGPGPNPPRVKGDTNEDGIVDLVDLSNMIDWFGIDDSNSEWNRWYTYFDFNNNGNIDIYDISYVAQLIK